jgi:hypothetical protein
MRPSARIAALGAVTTSIVLRSEPPRPIGRDLLRMAD